MFDFWFDGDYFVFDVVGWVGCGNGFCCVVLVVDKVVLEVMFDYVGVVLIVIDLLVVGLVGGDWCIVVLV